MTLPHPAPALPSEIRLTPYEKQFIEGTTNTSYKLECQIEGCDWHDQCDLISSGYRWATEHVLRFHMPVTWFFSSPGIPWKMAHKEFLARYAVDPA